MKSFSEYLEEAKSVGIVYHYTTLFHSILILGQDILRTGNLKIPFISLTRDKNFHARIGNLNGVDTDVRFVIDGTKLSHKYKITPYHDYKYFGYKSARGYIDEQEERVHSTKINNISTYILKVEVFRNTSLAKINRLEELCKEINIEFENKSKESFL